MSRELATQTRVRSLADGPKELRCENSLTWRGAEIPEPALREMEIPGCTDTPIITVSLTPPETKTLVKETLPLPTINAFIEVRRREGSMDLKPRSSSNDTRYP